MLPLSEFDGTFQRILCEKDGETLEILPFYQNAPTCAEDSESPYGCEFGYLHNAQNTRIYFAETVLAVESELTLISLDFYQLETPLLQNNTRIIAALTRNQNINSVFSSQGYAKERVNLGFLDSEPTKQAEATA